MVVSCCYNILCLFIFLLVSLEYIFLLKQYCLKFKHTHTYTSFTNTWTNTYRNIKRPKNKNFMAVITSRVGKGELRNFYRILKKSKTKSTNSIYMIFIQKLEICLKILYIFCFIFLSLTHFHLCFLWSFIHLDSNLCLHLRLVYLIVWWVT